MKWKIISLLMVCYFVFMISQGIYDKTSFVLYVGGLTVWSVIFGNEWRTKL